MLVLPPPLVDSCPADKSSRSSTWTSYQGSALGSSKTFSSELERGERIKPERANRRNAVQKMQWRSSRWVTGFAAGDYLAGPDADLDHRISSMTIADVSPRFAVKRILLLYENQQHREAANFINRLSHGTFKVIVNDLPIDLFVESMPASLSILEALYAKVFLSDGLDFSLKLLRPEAVVMQMVRLFAGGDANNSWQLCGPFVTSCKKLLKVIVLSEPKIRKVLQARRRALDKAIEGLGQHGLVGTSDETLMNLHDALKVEFSRVVETYKGAMQKLEELSLAGQAAGTGINRGPAPVQASHQRQLSLRQPEIQERLIKNKTLLNVVEPTMGNHSLDILLGILQRRIECDKDALFQFTTLKKEARSGVTANDIVAPVLMRFSHGCDQVLELMKEVTEDDEDSSDISGYHSDSDSAIMMSGNSPYVSKRARYNFLTRSVRSSSKCSRLSVLGGALGALGPLGPKLSTSSGVSSGLSSGGSVPDSGPECAECSGRGGSASSGSSSEEAASSSSPTPTVTQASSSASAGPQRLRHLKHKKELLKANSVPGLRAEVDTLRSELAVAKTRLTAAEDQSPSLAVLQRQADGALGADRLVACYANLYSQARVDTLDALDALPALRDATELKSKILFSVVVLAFRSAQSLLALKKDHVRRILHLPSAAHGQDHPGDGSAAAAALEQHVSAYLRRTVDTFDLTKSIDEVCSQIWATLYDYPSLKTCTGLLQYVRDSVRLAWALVNQNPTYVLEYEQRHFRRDVHVRFHSSNPDSDAIRTYLWPALLEGAAGPCVHKAVVLT
ncbi:hypothetical protein ONE63_010079 [Megalurothrips usitatus]|uniref:Mitochondria-eating protein n=1 Tax=Megalurothrips usitatus TaxID=439358 RepID=A0AAV7XGQ0_9NEOP|nr:hypothetical protein ONE63_010079 [Megalurothrips usitatus]